MSVKKTPDPSDQHVGNRVRMRRLMTKMSQTDLSRALGLSWQAVQKYEERHSPHRGQPVAANRAHLAGEPSILL